MVRFQQCWSFGECGVLIYFLCDEGHWHTHTRRLPWGLPEVVGTVQQVHCSRRRLLRRGLEFHVWTINKSAHTKKKSGNLSYAPRIKYIWFIKKSSCRAISTDISDPLSPHLPIVHCFLQVLKSTSLIGTELLYVGSSETSCLCTYELVPTSAAVSRMSASSNFDSFRDRCCRWPFSGAVSRTYSILPVK